MFILIPTILNHWFYSDEILGQCYMLLVHSGILFGSENADRVPVSKIFCFLNINYDTAAVFLRHRSYWLKNKNYDELMHYFHHKNTQWIFIFLKAKKNMLILQMRPLLRDECCRSRRSEELLSSCADSEQDDTEYVLMQMQKSRESLAVSLNTVNKNSILFTK